jgi:uncharacterized repeat protein (TIGR03803 family)/autotransporter-associated beta strand protein
MPSARSESRILSAAIAGLSGTGFIAGRAFAQPTYVINTLANFDGNDGQAPWSPLVLSGSTLYGATDVGGLNNAGVVFSLPISGGNPDDIASFSSLAYPNEDLTPLYLVLSGQTLFGTTFMGGAYGGGAVYSVPMSGGSPNILASFNPNSALGANPANSFAVSGNTIYGTTLENDSNPSNGAVWSLPTSGGTPQTLAILTNSAGSGAGGLLLDGSTLYGDGAVPGTSGFSIFTLPVSGGTPSVLIPSSYGPTPWTAISGNTLYDISGSGLISVPLTGGTPQVLASSFNGTGLLVSGNMIYSVIEAGGPNRDGSVVSVPTTGGTPTTLVTFDGLDGMFPFTKLLMNNGILYGTTSSGGENGDGTVFEVAPALTWNNSLGANPSDGKTWDTVQNNWNNGSITTNYSDGNDVVFNDENNGNYDVTLDTTVNPASVTINATGDYSITGSGTIGGTAALTNSGAGTLTLATANTYSGGTIVTNGKVTIEPTGSESSALANGPLTITGGEVQLAKNVTEGSQSGSAPTSNVTLTSLSISGNGTLDIGNNHIIITYGDDSDPISTIVGYLQSGFNNGNWNGPGIVSSSIVAANANPNAPQYGIGFSNGADQINGHPIVSGLSSGQIEIKYTLLGDANLDGTVNGADFSILAANFGQGYTNWDQGNFLFTPAVNGADFSALAHNFGQGDSGADVAISQTDIQALDAFALANNLTLPAIGAVPEPAAAMLLLSTSVGTLLRRRRK